MSICCTIVVVFFFFKQKTAYEMRISDWSSDVCSSDLARRAATPVPPLFRRVRVRLRLAAVTQLVDPEGVVLLGPVEVDLTRSDEPREGKEGVSQVSSRWSPYQ